MHIRDLMDRTGVAERQIRYLIAEGFMPAPRGGRSNAEYGEDHVAAVARYMRLKELGFPPAAIRLLLTAESGVPFPVAPGVTLVVSPDLMASGKEAAPLIERVARTLTRILKEPPHASSASRDRHG